MKLLLFLFFVVTSICLYAQRFNAQGTSWFQGNNTPLPFSAGEGIAIGMGTGATGGYIFGFDYLTYLPKNLWLQSPGGSVLIGHTAVSPNGKLDVRTTSVTAIYARTSLGNAITGQGGNLGVYGISTAGGAGVFGESSFVGVEGLVNSSDVNRQGVRGEINADASGGYAGLFQGGSTWVVGTLIKNAGSFMIDHPLEPESKYLLHSFVESPDMKNIYDGVIITDQDGIARVSLPDWFEALNMEFRYQLTCMGQFAQAIVLEEIQGNQFVIQTDKPGVKVSWQVTGVRHDPYAVKNRIPVEKQKSAEDQGRYIYPAGYNKPPEMGLQILTPTQRNQSSVRMGE